VKKQTRVLSPEFAFNAALLDAARNRPHCCECPHEDYLTVSVIEHRHECSSCGETFVDAKRVKVYFGRGPR